MIIPRLLKSSFERISRNFCNIIRQELTVQPFCDIQVNIPYNVKIKPLDVHKYHNSDLLKIELLGIENDRGTIKHLQDGNNIKIFAKTDDFEKDITCCIHAPIKANLNISAHGDISAGAFGGSKLVLKSREGNIYVNKFQGEIIDLNTQDGDIFLKGAIIAAKIKIVANSGSIKIKRLQGLESLVRSNNGNITVDSSYCDNGIFEAISGELNLQNIHKNSKILLKNGKLILTGVDGQIEACLENSDAEIQLSRILEDSKIKMTKNGELKLQISEECQENTMFEIRSKKHLLDQNVKLIPSQNVDILYLTPTTENYKEVLIECDDTVHIQSASWINMLKLKNAEK